MVVVIMKDGEGEGEGDSAMEERRREAKEAEREGYIKELRTHGDWMVGKAITLRPLYDQSQNDLMYTLFLC